MSHEREEALVLTDDEADVLNLQLALSHLWMSPQDRADYDISPDDRLTDAREGDKLAHRLGLGNEDELASESNRLGDAVSKQAPLSYADWTLLLQLIRRLASPADDEWETVTGFDYGSTVLLLAQIEHKVAAAFK